MTEKRNRFPGAKPFTAEDKEVFHGREKDIEKLFELLRLKRMIVLYAESGIGKSSLVNAGLIPKYHTPATVSQFLAVKIRFGLLQFTDENKGSVEILLTRIIEELNLHKNLLKRKDLPFAEAKIENSLWYQVKLFERNDIRLLLAFDQFEETFSYSNEQVNLFKEQLFSVFSGVPKDLNESISEKIKLVEEQTLDQQELLQLDEDLKFIYAPLNTQILYIIREDKLGFFNSFTNYFPDILKDTFKLLPLSRSSATEAITLPAGKEGNFKTAPFTFSQPALEKLLNRLAEKNDTYDPFTIQLTCRYIEKILIDEAGKREIEENDIPEVGIIVKDFIDSAWKTLPAALQKNVDTYKEMIETRLIAADIEKRVSVHESDWIDDKVVTALINEGLLKRDRRGDVDYIELSHDRLIKPLLEDYKLRKQQEKIKKQQRRNRIIGAAISLILVSVAAYFIYNNKVAKDIAEVQNKVIKDSIVSLTEDIKNTDSTAIVTYLANAEDFANKKNYQQAIDNFKLAISTAKKTDTSKMNEIIALENKLIPAEILKQNETGNNFKIDVFYDERTLPESETTADWIIGKLQLNKGFIVRKRLLTIATINKSATYDIQKNIIRHEQNKEETSLADSLIKNLNSFAYIQSNNKIFSTQPVSSGFKSPNYISIFIHY
jgi:hypothetical protein